MIKRIFVISVVFLCSSVGPLLAHSSYKHHAREICDIFPFQYQRNDNDKMFYWAGYISSWLIDGVGYQDFESKIHKQFPQLTWSAGNHRIFFHWGFNSVPWNAELERLTKGWSPDKIKALKYLLINEQRKRNGYANRETEKLFHYQPNGNSGKIANALVSIAYDIHLVGDYMTDNTNLSGLEDFTSIIEDIIKALSKIDLRLSKSITKRMKNILYRHENVQIKADDMMCLLKNELPIFFLYAQDGQFVRHCQNYGFKLRSDYKNR